MLYFDYSGGISIVDQYDLNATVDRVATVSDIDPEYVITPVLVASEPVQLKILTRPARLHVEWRGSNLVFEMNYLFPEWNTGTPNAAYRYWQARVKLTDPHTVLDRIEFVIQDVTAGQSDITFNL